MTTISEHRLPHEHRTDAHDQPVVELAPVAAAHDRDEVGAVSAEYAVVTAAGVGFGGLLIKLLTSDFAQALLKQILDFFLSQVGLA